MRIWHAYVGPGRFIIRAQTEQEAIDLARKKAEDYYPKGYDIWDEPSGCTELDPVGPPEVLDIDFS